MDTRTKEFYCKIEFPVLATKIWPAKYAVKTVISWLCEEQLQDRLNRCYYLDEGNFFRVTVIKSEWITREEPLVVPLMD